MDTLDQLIDAAKSITFDLILLEQRMEGDAFNNSVAALERLQREMAESH